MGNGAKAKQKRERTATNNKTQKSQLKANEKSMSIKCETCKQPFMGTTRGPELESHRKKNHSDKDRAECFPDFIWESEELGS